MPTFFVGQTFQYAIACKFITDGWVDPDDIWTSFQSFQQRDFLISVKWIKETCTMRMVIPDRYLGSGSGSKRLTTRVEVTGRFVLADDRSLITQLLDHVQSLSVDDLRSNMELSLHIPIPPQPGEESTDDGTEGHGSEEDDLVVEENQHDFEEHEISEEEKQPTRENVRPVVRKPPKRESPVHELLARRATFPSLPINIDERTEVKRSNIEGAGDGLFAKFNMRKGTTVVAMQSPGLVNQKERDAAIAKGFRDDVFFHLERTHGPLKRKHKQCFLYDKSFKDPEEPPQWYYLNHGASSANLILNYDEKKNKVTWDAKFDIPQGSELYFNYNPGEKTSF
jgi:hypothetical protein